MFNQPLFPCRGSAVQAAARGRAVPGCAAHMNIQWLPNVSPWGPSALIQRGHTHSRRRHGLRRVEYSTTDYILSIVRRGRLVVKKLTFAISSPDEFLFVFLYMGCTLEPPGEND